MRESEQTGQCFCQSSGHQDAQLQSEGGLFTVTLALQEGEQPVAGMLTAGFPMDSVWTQPKV